ncbi:hypothetical protein PCANC_18494 [Puccinia coronata f. sp. avenae]|uniref:Uncharacterized protein n=1 Tax=Puccinia coronata f. sp. avenae TaxID=200324 RepID=A0A2N5T1F2_9BASI|nr:hypothetical protein PCANC_18494 [Puccinia coronata f. sp. avenae]PLW44145.1 hypothetical protein PCASD_09586 [Puccinia coronata f. sp. avenae]
MPTDHPVSAPLCFQPTPLPSPSAIPATTPELYASLPATPILLSASQPASALLPAHHPAPITSCQPQGPNSNPTLLAGLPCFPHPPQPLPRP